MGLPAMNRLKVRHVLPKQVIDRAGGDYASLTVALVQVSRDPIQMVWRISRYAASICSALDDSSTSHPPVGSKAALKAAVLNL